MVMSRMLMSAGGVFVLEITASSVNPNLRTLAIAAGWGASQKLIVDITAPLVNTLNLGSTPFVSGLRINVSASTRIGGVKNSGDAFYTRVPVEVSNLGIISGGGGRGGAGMYVFADYSASRVFGDGGAGGSGQGFSNTGSLIIDAATNGNPGTYQQYAGTVLGGQTAPWAQGGSGGSGGAWGAAGTQGGIGSTGGSTTGGGIVGDRTDGAAPGAAVNGNSFVTWIATGTRQGGLIN